MLRLLIIRFSALGDVAMTVPVVHSLAQQHRQLRITVLTKAAYAPLYSFAPANVETIGVQFEEYKGVAGLMKLFNQLRERKFDAVADLHDVLRSKFLRTQFWLIGKPVAVIEKDRKGKHELIGQGQEHTALQPMYDRYVDTFRKLGLEVKMDFKQAFNPRQENFSSVFNIVGRKQAGERWVGVAPFAAHATKIYPLSSMRRVAEMLTEKGFRVFLFGAGATEQQELDSWQSSRICNVCGKGLGLRGEMLLMSKLDAMIAMDSANMHIAALTGIPVLSIWGGTHPKMGFTPWGQPASNILQDETLSCRPCSVYGGADCRLGDLRCLTAIKPEQVVDKCLQLISHDAI